MSLFPESTFTLQSVEYYLSKRRAEEEPGAEEEEAGGLRPPNNGLLFAVSPVLAFLTTLSLNKIRKTVSW